jgi:hypothetical protein
MVSRLTIFVATVCFMSCFAYADYGVSNHGTWPGEWPMELESLRKQSQTFEGPQQPLLHYAIPFTDRAEFESAWPHILKVKSKAAPIILLRGPSFWLEGKSPGVCIHTPPKGHAPIVDGKVARGNWEQTIYIELIVDGDIVDLNRIQLPPDTPIIDDRFKGSKSK